MKQGKVRQRFPVRTKATSDACNTAEWQDVPAKRSNPNARKPNPVHVRGAYQLDGKPDRVKEHEIRRLNKYR